MKWRKQQKRYTKIEFNSGSKHICIFDKLKEKILYTTQKIYI